MGTNADSDERDQTPFERADPDPHAYLKADMRVVGEHGQGLGKVQLIERDEATGQVVGLMVRHGLLGRRTTRVPADQVRWVNQDSVVLDLSRGDFKRLPAG